MKIRYLFLLTLLSLVFTSCIDLDIFVAPAIFDHTSYSNTQPYLLGAYTNAELYTQVESNPAWVDAILFDNVTNSNSQELVSSGTNTLYAYYLQHLIGGSGKTILYFHGNTYSMDKYWPRAKLLFNTGADVFMIDYRGFGKSQGIPTEAGLLADGEAALDYLITTLGVTKADILVYGFSLGTVPATHVAAYANIDTAIGLVLEAPIGSVEIYIQDATFLPIPDSYLTQFKLDNVSAIQDVSLPYLWLHGTADTTQMYNTHGQAVYDHYGGSTRHAKLVPGAIHTDVPLVMDADFSDYLDGISNFISDTLTYPFP